MSFALIAFSLVILRIITVFSESSEDLITILSNLDKEISGEVILYDLDSYKYNRERTQWNSQFNNYYPLAIIMMETEDDISTSLKELFIKPENRDYSLRIRSAPLGGHLWNGYSVANDSIVFDLSRFNSITPITTGTDNDDAYNDKIFKIGVGSTQEDVNKNLEPFFKLILTSGDCPQFSFGGFIQGGGLSLLLRSYGISADYVVAADIVLAKNGKIIHATMENEYNDILHGIKGGGAGNFGIITNYYIKSINAPNSVLSFEVYWDLPDNAQAISTFLKAWEATQSDDNAKEWTSWLVVLNNGEKYIIRMLGIWNGDITQGYTAWNAFNDENGLTYDTTISVIKETTVYDAVSIHQSTFAGESFDGIIDARTVKYEWTDEIFNKIGETMIEYHNENTDVLSYIWLFVRYGGAMYSNDPNNEYTAFGNRDAKGDITFLIAYNSDDDIDGTIGELALSKMEEIDYNLLDSISEYYYPNHPRSYDIPDADISIAYYDYDNKPWLYEKLQTIKSKYDPMNLFNNPVTITVDDYADNE